MNGKILLSYVHTKNVIKTKKHRGIILLNACYKQNIKILNEKLKVKAAKFFWNNRMDSEKAHLASIHCLARNYLWKKEESLIRNTIYYFLKT